MSAKLDPKQKPPDSLKALHKSYQKISQDALAKDINVKDFGRVQEDVTAPRVSVVTTLDGSKLAQISSRFQGCEGDAEEPKNVKVYECVDLPDSHEFSFFDILPGSSFAFPAIEPSTHAPVTVAQFLNRKLRWITLGGQYDWSKKAYPEGNPPEFPKDIAWLIHEMFPNIRPEAAIVNVYTAGDTLSIHRDVSEDSDAGLVSISLGCDAIFIAGLEEESTGKTRHIVLRLRSGDAVYMSGPSRYAWHSVPQILADTCPPWLSHWPADTSLQGTEPTYDARFEAWRGWIANKRINLNIRQMSK
ncbi:MAG: hypothetical protein Q9209_007285 [Squamulea sp. 1 TL-2023]